MRQRALLMLCAALSAAALASTTALAQSDQNYPSRSVRFVVPFSAGGPTDIAARMIADHVSKRWGQPVIVENRVGGGSVIGSQVVAQADPDGYTLLLGPSSALVENSALMRKLPYDPIKSFTPIAEIYGISAGLSVNGKVPAKSLAELIALARAQPLNYSSFGIGSGPHLLIETLKSAAKIDIAHVPFKGNVEGLAAVVAGDVQMTGAGLGTVRPYLQSGQLRLLAVAGDSQTKFAPGVPTFKELGYASVGAGSQFIALWGPAGMPGAVVTTINTGVQEALAKPEFAGFLEKFAYFPASGNTPADLGRLMSSSLDTWEPIIRSLGIEIGSK